MKKATSPLISSILKDKDFQDWVEHFATLILEKDPSQHDELEKTVGIIVIAVLEAEARFATKQVVKEKKR